MHHLSRAPRMRLPSPSSRRRRERHDRLRRTVESLEPRRCLSGTQLVEDTEPTDQNNAALISDDEPSTSESSQDIVIRLRTKLDPSRLLTLDKRVLLIRDCPGLDPKLCTSDASGNDGGSNVRFNLSSVLAAEQLRQSANSLATDATFAGRLDDEGSSKIQLPVFVP